MECPLSARACTEHWGHGDKLDLVSAYKRPTGQWGRQMYTCIYKSHRQGGLVEGVWTLGPAPPPPSCVALGQYLSLSELWLFDMKSSHEDTYLTGWL